MGRSCEQCPIFTDWNSYWTAITAEQQKQYGEAIVDIALNRSQATVDQDSLRDDLFSTQMSDTSQAEADQLELQKIQLGEFERNVEVTSENLGRAGDRLALVEAEAKRRCSGVVHRRQWWIAGPMIPTRA